MAEKDQFLNVSVEGEGGDTLSIRRFSVHEALSHPFEVNLFVRSREASLKLEALVNKPASFRIISGHQNVPDLERERTWLGVCSHFEQLRAEPTTDKVEGRSTYFLRIVPTLWLLSQSRDHRIFRHMAIPDIVKEVLKEWDITPEMKVRTDGYHKELEYVVQYGETDLAFVSRLLEEAGITYCFHHDKDAMKLLLIDEPHRVVGRDPIGYEDQPTEAGQFEYLTHVRLSHRVKPGAVTIRDYDFHKRPDVALLGKAPPAADPEKFYEHYFYEPGGFRVKAEGSLRYADQGGSFPFRHEEKEGKARAERVLESLRRGKRSVSFETNCVALAPGRVFSMKDHPRTDLAAPMLCTEFSMDGEPAGKWLLIGESVFTDAPYRPVHKTPRPRIPGVQSAIVVGGAKADETEIYPDELGRVKVQFHWDRKGKFDDKSSCWMRVSQQWAGSGFGTMMIPRVGQEVLVGYLEGDPNMPVIIGRVYDSTRPVPYRLSNHDTKTLWKTKTSPDDKEGGAYNELRFDDKTEEELVYVQAQRNFQELVKENETERTGKSRVIVVGKHRTAVVAKVDAHLVGEKYSIQVIKQPDQYKQELKDKKELKILDQKKPDLTPLPTKLEMVDQKIITTAGKATMVMEGADVIFTAKGGEITFKAKEIYVFGGSNIKINCT